MTLNTTLVLHEWTDPVELHTWFNREVLGVANKNPIIHQTETGIRNGLGQGFDAIFEVEWEKGGAPYEWFDFEAEKTANLKYVPDIYATEADATKAAEESRSYYADYPTGVIKINWDTAYGFRGERGEGCSALHVKFITRLAREYLEPLGIGFHWQNEYSGEWNEGLTGFEAFAGDGLEAFEWFAGQVLPAIAVMAAKERDNDD